MTFRQFAYRNVVRNGRIYAAFFMASVFSVMVFFLYSMLLFHPQIEDQFVREFAFFGMADRKSTRLNSSHVSISYAVFCLKKKKNTFNRFRALGSVIRCVPDQLYIINAH